MHDNCSQYGLGRPLIALIAVLLLCFVGAGAYFGGTRFDLFAAKAVDEQPSGDEGITRTRLAKSLLGEILFDSNRSGTFGIYGMRPDGAELRTIFDSDRHEMYPASSPDGTWIVFASATTTERDSESSIWMIRADGSEPRKLAENATFPRFNRDGTKIFFQRGRKAIGMLSLADGTISRIFPSTKSGWGNYQIVHPRVSPDERYAAFTSDKGGKWHAWVVDLNSADEEKIAKGCEPGWFPDSTRLAFIHKATAKERSGIFSIQRGSGEARELQDADAPRGHEYFPSVTSDGRYLLYSAARPREHDHITANYQLFVRPLDSRDTVRITFDRFNNRWPTLRPVPAF